MDLYFQSPENLSYKFGYYNFSAISGDGTKLLAHKIDFEGRDPLPDDKVDIGYFDITNGIWNKLAESSAFNWQQGSMLQWIGPNFNNEIIFNDSDGQKYIARIININTSKERQLPQAIYALDPNGRFSISLNFERSYYTRAYSYAPVQNKFWNQTMPLGDGIFKIDLKTGACKTIIPIEEIIKICGSQVDPESAQWFEHIMLNLSGSRFAFYHRYGSIDKFYTRVFSSDINGHKIWQHPISDNERNSHLGWQNDENYVLYTIQQSRITTAWVGKSQSQPKYYVNFYRRYLKPYVPRRIVSILPKATSYYALTKDQQGIFEKLNPLPGNMDGHPSFTKDGLYMLTDTYADKQGYRHLLVYNMKSNNTFLLGKFYSHFNDCSWRADLHPRFSPDEQKVIIDSGHDGYHRIVVLDIDWDVIGKNKIGQIS